MTDRPRLSPLALGLALGLGLGLPATADPASLTVFTWSGYEDPELYALFAERHGGSPSFTFFGDEDEAFQKLVTGFTADLAHPCGDVARWRAAGLLQPFDRDRIAAFDQLLPELVAMDGDAIDATGQVWFLPFDWGNTALTWNIEALTAEEVASLQIFADPRVAGRVSLPDNADDGFSLGLLAVGVTDWTAATDAEWEAAAEFLRRVHANTRFYWQDTTELNQAMAGGEVDLAWAWNATATQLAAEGHPIAMNTDTAEGTATWFCGLVHLASSTADPDLVYDFVNAKLDASVTEYMITAWGYGHSNKAGLAAMDPEVLAEAGFGDFGDLEAFFARSLLQSPLPHERRVWMVTAYERIKAGF